MVKLTLANIFALVLMVTVVWMMMSEVANGAYATETWYDKGCDGGLHDQICIDDCKLKRGESAVGYCKGSMCVCLYTVLECPTPRNK